MVDGQQVELVGIVEGQEQQDENKSGPSSEPAVDGAEDHHKDGEQKKDTGPGRDLKDINLPQQT